MQGIDLRRGSLEGSVSRKKWIPTMARTLILRCVGTLLALSALLASQPAAARGPSQSHKGDACGQTRFVLVRFLDESPVPGVSVLLSAVPASMGGPELYKADASDAPDTPGARDQLAEAEDHPESLMPVTLTPGRTCDPVITGTLVAETNAKGLARFDNLREGTWVLRFEGTITRGHKTASVVPAAVQGRSPYGRTREGGGFTEQVDALNEEGGPNPEPIQPSVAASTSRYLLQFSTEYAGWLPGLDMASEDEVQPVPLADVTLVQEAEKGSSESTFDSSSVALVPPQDLPFSEGGQPHGEQPFSLWLATVLGLALGGSVALACGKWDRWGRRRVGEGDNWVKRGPRGAKGT
jgi:hypothetical protein